MLLSNGSLSESLIVAPACDLYLSRSQAGLEAFKDCVRH